MTITDFVDGDRGTYVVAPPDRYEDSQYLDDPLSAEEREQRETTLRQKVEQREGMRREGTRSPGAGRSVGEPVERELDRMSDEDSDDAAH